MDDQGAAAGNVPEFSVSDLSGAIRRTLEGAFGRVRVRGEITECRPYPSGHIYLSLKDESAKISAVIWRSAVARLGLTPENGVEVVATGRLTTHGERSTYQLSIERLEYAGAGALLARVEALRLRLAAEGLFEAARKRPFPRLPTLVGVITSAQGAVIRDIVTTIARRCPRPIVLWPVPVQGAEAAPRIAAAIAGFCHAMPRPDVLIVARGGGSLEDLMAFNDEAVVRAAATCPIPLISAVGHETDTTLIDFAADRRAPTPTAAAELAVPERAALLAELGQLDARRQGAMRGVLQRDRLMLHRAASGLPDLPGLLGGARQRLDDRALRLQLALPNLVRSRHAALERAAAHLPAALPRLVARRRDGLAVAAAHLRGEIRHALATRGAAQAATAPRLSPAVLAGRLREARTRLEALAARLESVSHHGVLARGYAAVFRPDGHPVTQAAEVRAGAELRVVFADGEVRVRAGGRGDPRQGALL